MVVASLLHCLEKSILLVVMPLGLKKLEEKAMFDCLLVWMTSSHINAAALIKLFRKRAKKTFDVVLTRGGQAVAHAP